MSYKCRVCEAAVASGQPLRKHTILRLDGSIRTEVQVCRKCDEDLKAIPFDELCEIYRSKANYKQGA